MTDLASALEVIRRAAGVLYAAALIEASRGAMPGDPLDHLPEADR